MSDFGQADGRVAVVRSDDCRCRAISRWAGFLSCMAAMPPSEAFVSGQGIGSFPKPLPRQVCVETFLSCAGPPLSGRCNIPAGVPLFCLFLLHRESIPTLPGTYQQHESAVSRRRALACHWPPCASEAVVACSVLSMPARRVLMELFILIARFLSFFCICIWFDPRRDGYSRHHHVPLRTHPARSPSRSPSSSRRGRS